MIYTPITDSFIADMELTLIRILPHLLANLKQDKIPEARALTEEDKESWFFKSKQEKIIESLKGTYNLSKTFHEKIDEVKNEVEHIVNPDDILKWVHIFRVKFSVVSTRLAYVEEFKQEGGYWKLAQEMVDAGEIEKSAVSDIGMWAHMVVDDCQFAMHILTNFFNALKRMAELPSTSEEANPYSLSKFLTEEGQKLIPYIQDVYKNKKPGHGLTALIMAFKKLNLFRIDVTIKGQQTHFHKALEDILGKIGTPQALNNSIATFDRTKEYKKQQQIDSAVKSIQTYLLTINRL